MNETETMSNKEYVVVYGVLSLYSIFMIFMGWVSSTETWNFGYEFFAIQFYCWGGFGLLATVPLMIVHLRDMKTQRDSESHMEGG